MKKMLSLLIVAALTCFLAVSAFGADPADTGKTIFTTVCANCHGMDAMGAKGPKLQGQQPAQLIEKLDGYRAGTYGSSRKATMQGVVQKYSADELKMVTEYIGTLK